MMKHRDYLRFVVDVLETARGRDADRKSTYPESTTGFALWWFAVGLQLPAGGR